MSVTGVPYLSSIDIRNLYSLVVVIYTCKAYLYILLERTVYMHQRGAGRDKEMDYNELVECVGRDNVRKICERFGCYEETACVPRTGHVELCAECYAQLKIQYPECIVE